MSTVMYKDGKTITVKDGLAFGNSGLTGVQIWEAQGWSTSPPTQSPIVSSPVVVQQPIVQQVQTAKQKRIEEGNFAVYSTIPEVAALQRKSREIYENTGRWDTSEQKSLNALADQIRKGLNPTYPGGDKGFTDAQFFLPGSGSASGLSNLISGLLGAGKQVTETAASPANNFSSALLIGGAAIGLLLLRGR